MSKVIVFENCGVCGKSLSQTSFIIDSEKKIARCLDCMLDKEVKTLIIEFFKDKNENPQLITCIQNRDLLLRVYDLTCQIDRLLKENTVSLFIQKLEKEYKNSSTENSN